MKLWIWSLVLLAAYVAAAPVSEPQQDEAEVTEVKGGFHSNKSDHFQISPAASPEIITSHSMENLAFHSLLRWKRI